MNLLHRILLPHESDTTVDAAKKRDSRIILCFFIAAIALLVCAHTIAAKLAMRASPLLMASLSLPILIPPIGQLYVGVRRMRGRRRGATECPLCTFDLREHRTARICPECGKAFDIEDVRKYWNR